MFCEGTSNGAETDWLSGIGPASSLPQTVSALCGSMWLGGTEQIQGVSTNPDLLHPRTEQPLAVNGPGWAWTSASSAKDGDVPR